MQQVIISITAQDNHFMNAFDSHFSASLGTLALFNQHLHGNLLS